MKLLYRKITFSKHFPALFYNYLNIPCPRLSVYKHILYIRPCHVQTDLIGGVPMNLPRKACEHLQIYALYETTRCVMSSLSEKSM